MSQYVLPASHIVSCQCASENVQLLQLTTDATAAHAVASGIS